MILETILIVGIIIGFLNSRSITLADRTISGDYFLISSKSQVINLIISILMFLGMISTFALILWGFVYLKWYFSIIGIIVSTILCQQNLVGKLFLFKELTHLFLNILVIAINSFLWIIKFL